MLKLSSDERGELGEKILFDVISKQTNLPVEWEGNKNTSRNDGSIWDININGYRVEVKTAMRGTSTAVWQHEKIVEENCWDKVIFFDFNHSSIWITVQDHSQMPFNNDRHKILNKKSTFHLGGWKFDLTESQIKKLENEGYSINIDINQPNNESISEFIIRHFS